MDLQRHSERHTCRRKNSIAAQLRWVKLFQIRKSWSSTSMVYFASQVRWESWSSEDQPCRSATGKDRNSQNACSGHTRSCPQHIKTVREFVTPATLSQLTKKDSRISSAAGTRRSSLQDIESVLAKSKKHWSKP